MSHKEHFFETQEALVESLSQSILGNLEEAIHNKGFATLLVSGGSTPKPLFQSLRKRAIAWEKVKVGLCDERWVEIGHDDSNAKLVHEVLLQEKASLASFVGMYNGEEEKSKAEEVCSKSIQAELFPFDVLVLGMGTDAHTASLFPNNARLEEAFSTDQLCMMIEPTTAKHKRMSLTLNAILSAKNIYLHFEGEAKQKVYEEALKSQDKMKMPIGAVLNQTIKNIEVYYQ